MIVPWRITLLGGLRVQRGEEIITRFRTQKTASLLAYLAFHSTQPQLREVLVEVLWPEAEFDEGRHSLRMALTSLRHQLEPPGIPAGAVIQANRTTVQLHPETVRIDVVDFETAAQKTHRAESATQASVLRQVVDLYGGPLLPGFYESWIVPQMLRLQEEYNDIVMRLLACLRSANELDGAIQCAVRAIAFDPLQEEMHLLLMQLYGEANRPQEALRLYRTWQERLAQEWGQPPSEAMQELARTLGWERSQQAATRSTRPSVQPLPSPLSAPSTPTSPASSPALRDTGLPVALSRCFGREQEIETLVSLLPPSASTSIRLLTLTGMGGTGKTRLAIELGQRLAETFAHHIAFVPLETVTDPARIAEAIADALHLARTPHRTPMEQVVQAVTGPPFLLLLDNFEQLVETGGSVLKSLLARCPRLICLVTSRQLLHLEGEQEFPVLPLPAPGAETRLEALLDCASVRLFINRAQAARPDFQLTPHNARAVAELCNRLDGIPLAIEMAAGWARTLTPVQMLAQMARRFELLVSRRKDLAERHRSLRVTLDWSYQHLPPPLQQFLTQLSVFRGGWTLDAAEAVCEEPDALEFLTELRERSFIVAEDGGAEIRFRMLETVRAFTREQLSETECAALEAQHVQYFLQEALTAEPHLTGPTPSEWLNRLNWDYDNLRQALENCRHQPETGLRLATSLWRFWRMSGRWKEGLGFLLDMLHCPENATPSLERARALSGAGNLARSIGQYEEAQRYLEESLAFYEQAGEEQGIAGVLNNLSLVSRETGSYDKTKVELERALEINRRHSNRAWEVTNLTNLGLTYLAVGDFSESDRYFREALQLLSPLSNPYGMANLYYNYGYMLLMAGRLEEAERYCTESLRLLREMGTASEAAFVLADLGYIAARHSETSIACQYYRESLKSAGDTINLKNIAMTLRWLGYLCVEQGQTEEAARLLGAAAALQESLQNPLLPCEGDEDARIRAALQAAMGEADFQRHRDTGSQWSWEEAVAYALEVCASEIFINNSL